MGLGDNLMASGMARGAKARGKRIAFGNCEKIIWDHHSEQIFRGNPNIAKPDDLIRVTSRMQRDDLEWIPFYRGNRIYNRQGKDRWIWNYDFKAQPGEVFLTPEECSQVDRYGGEIVLIEPNVPAHKTVAPNKQWPVFRYQALVEKLKFRGYRVCQPYYEMARNTLKGAEMLKLQSFRHALALMRNVKLYIGPEGGLHHGSAAMGTPAVVLFGGFIPPAVTGYDAHTNLVGTDDFCGSLARCDHCKNAMEKITVEHVHEAAMRFIGR